MTESQFDDITVECKIPAIWAMQLEAIAQRLEVPTTQLVTEAIGLYLTRHMPVAPSMANGMSYEDLEQEPDEILWDFLPLEERPADSKAQSHHYDLGDDLDEILPDFLEP